MALRQELMPPHLCETRVARLADLAAEIDGADLDRTRNQLAEFNREAMTHLTFFDFQGIHGAQDHDTWVRQILTGPYERCLKDLCGLFFWPGEYFGDGDDSGELTPKQVIQTALKNSDL
jgi:hypothetical protein